jgi:hypothetical protein
MQAIEAIAHAPAEFGVTKSQSNDDIKSLE